MFLQRFIYIYLLGFIFSMISCYSNNEDYPGAIEPPNTIREAFQTIYPKAEQDIWTVSNNYYVIHFLNQGLTNVTWLNHLGEWAMIKTNIPTDLLPSSILESIQQSNYQHWQLIEADTIRRAGMGTIYKTDMKLNKQEVYLYYTAYGSLIQAVTQFPYIDSPIPIQEQVSQVMKTDYPNSILLNIEITPSSDTLLAILEKTVLKIIQLPN